jgi:hypothetical protein
MSMESAGMILDYFVGMRTVEMQNVRSNTWISVWVESGVCTSCLWTFFSRHEQLARKTKGVFAIIHESCGLMRELLSFNCRSLSIHESSSSNCSTLSALNTFELSRFVL